MNKNANKRNRAFSLGKYNFFDFHINHRWFFFKVRANFWSIDSPIELTFVRNHSFTRRRIIMSLELSIKTLVLVLSRVSKKVGDSALTRISGHICGCQEPSSENNFCRRLSTENLNWPILKFPRYQSFLNSQSDFPTDKSKQAFDLLDDPSQTKL